MHRFEKEHRIICQCIAPITEAELLRIVWRFASISVRSNIRMHMAQNRVKSLVAKSALLSTFIFSHGNNCCAQRRQCIVPNVFSKVSLIDQMRNPKITKVRVEFFINLGNWLIQCCQCKRKFLFYMILVLLNFGVRSKTFQRRRVRKKAL